MSSSLFLQAVDYILFVSKASWRNYNFSENIADVIPTLGALLEVPVLQAKKGIKLLQRFITIGGSLEQISLSCCFESSSYFTQQLVLRA